MNIPSLDFGNAGSYKADLASQLDDALTNVGFVSVTNLGVEPELAAATFAASRIFFRSDLEVKNRYAHGSADENFGCQGFGQESLDPTKAVDLIETFTMRNVFARKPDDCR